MLVPRWLSSPLRHPANPSQGTSLRLCPRQRGCVSTGEGTAEVAPGRSPGPPPPWKRIQRLEESRKLGLKNLPALGAFFENEKRRSRSPSGSFFGYDVRCFLASRLKYSTLSLLNEIVTLHLIFSQNQRLRRRQKISNDFHSTQRFICIFYFAFHTSFSLFSSIPLDNTDHALPISEPDRQDSVIDAADTIISFFGITMLSYPS